MRLQGAKSESSLNVQSKEEQEMKHDEDGCLSSRRTKYLTFPATTNWMVYYYCCLVAIVSCFHHPVSSLSSSPPPRIRHRNSIITPTIRLQSLVDDNNYDTASSSSSSSSLPIKKKKQKLITTKKGKEAKVEFKDFWGSAITSVQEQERPPYVPTLDPFWGSLPKAAYQCEADEIWDPKPTCLIALDLTALITTKNENAVKMVQHYLESGFQTFHVGTNPQFIQEFHAQTPTKMIGKDSIHWVLKYQVPQKVQSLQSIRQDILDNLLDPMSSSSSSCIDAIDTLVVQYNSKSPYHMDVLYVLNELQEEGFIRSIGLENFPQKLVTKAVVECGFVVSLVQQPGSLLLSSSDDSRMRVSPMIQHYWTTNPFLNGLLLGGAADDNSSSKRRFKRSKHTTLQKHQQKLWDSTLQQWAKRTGITSSRGDEEEKDIFEIFQTKVMDVLVEMAWRYGVPLKSLLLRWAMEEVSSVVIPAPTGDIWNDMDFSSSSSPSSLWKAHIQELRQAFVFRIEEPDKALLAEMSRGKKENDDDGTGMMMDLGELEEFLVEQGLPEKEIEALLEEEQERQQQQGSSAASTTTTVYPKIEFDNPKLWL